MMKSTRTCCALTRLDPIILKVPTVTCCVGCPGAGNVEDWTYVIPKKRAEMYSEDENVPIDKTRTERRERREGKGG